MDDIAWDHADDAYYTDLDRRHGDGEHDGAPHENCGRCADQTTDAQEG